MKPAAAIVALLGLALVGSRPVHGQSGAAGQLVGAKAVKCAFSTMSTGNWNSSGAVAEIKPSTFTISFEDIDTEEGSARAVGAFGPSDIVVRLSSGTLHFMQSFREGPLYVTTIFPSQTRPGLLKAVHTRHEFTEVSLPGFTSRPEQYYGDCQITK